MSGEYGALKFACERNSNECVPAMYNATTAGTNVIRVL
jgi:hypothetical protein